MKIKSFSCETFCTSSRSDKEANTNSEVYIWAKWPFRPGLILVSVAWSDYKYFYYPEGSQVCQHHSRTRTFSRVSNEIQWIIISGMTRLPVWRCACAIFMTFISPLFTGCSFTSSNRWEFPTYCMEVALSAGGIRGFHLNILRKVNFLRQFWISSTHTSSIYFVLSQQKKVGRLIGGEICTDPILP